MAVNINTIKNWFKTGMIPTQTQFWSVFDSYRHKDDKVPVEDVEGINELLASRASKQVLDNHLSQKGAPGGYAPLDDFEKLPAKHLKIVNDLETGGDQSILSAEQGKILKELVGSKVGETYVDEQIDTVNLDITNTNKVCTQTGLTDQNDTCNAIQLSDTTFKLTAITSCVYHSKLYENSGVDAYVSHPETIHSLSEIGTLSDGYKIIYVGKAYDGQVAYSTNSFERNNSIVGICALKIRVVSGVATFMFPGINSKNITVRPCMAVDSELIRTLFGGITTNLYLRSNGNMTMYHDAFSIKGANVDWQPSTWNNFPHEKLVEASNLVSFLMLNPSITNTSVEPSFQTVFNPTKYFNKVTGLVTDIPNNTDAAVHAVYVSSTGGVLILMAEQYFTTIALAKENIFNVKFTTPLPNKDYEHKGFIVAQKNCTNIDDKSKGYIIMITGSGINGGGSTSTSDPLKEDIINKTDDYESFQDSSKKYLSVRGVTNFWDWVRAQTVLLNGHWFFGGGLATNTSGSSQGIEISHYSTRNGLYIYFNTAQGAWGGGSAVYLEAGSTSTGDVLVYNKNGSILLSINYKGEIDAPKVTANLVAKAGTMTDPPLIIPNGVITTVPQEGAIEHVNGELFFTFGGVRKKIQLI